VTVAYRMAYVGTVSTPPSTGSADGSTSSSIVSHSGSPRACPRRGSGAIGHGVSRARRRGSSAVISNPAEEPQAHPLRDGASTRFPHRKRSHGGRVQIRRDDAVKRSGQRWFESSLSPCLALRALHLSERLRPCFAKLQAARFAILEAA
jgi:hypothetical protein